MRILKLLDAQLSDFEQKVGKGNLVVIEKKDKNGDLEGHICLQRPSSTPNYFSTASRFRQIARDNKDLEAGELILRSCYLGGIQDYDPKKENDAIRNSALYVGVLMKCFQIADEDFIQGAQGLGFRIM